MDFLQTKYLCEFSLFLNLTSGIVQDLRNESYTSLYPINLELTYRLYSFLYFLGLWDNPYVNRVIP